MGRWNAVVNSLENREAISQAGVFDLQGNCLAASTDLCLRPSGAKALVSGFSDRTGGLFGVHVGEVLFTCYRAGEAVVIGKASDTYGATTTFAAMLTDESLIFCMMSGASGSRGSRGSVIGVMKSALSNSNKPPAKKQPLECRVEVITDDFPLIDLGIQP